MTRKAIYSTLEQESHGGFGNNKDDGGKEKEVEGGWRWHIRMMI
jgi:hypothetical protein